MQTTPVSPGVALPEIEGAEETGRPLTGPSRRRATTIVCLCAYLALGFLANLPVWLHGPSTVTICGGCGDNGQEVWFLALVAHAVAHGSNPLFTNWVNYPWGANLMDNTAMPLAGVIGAPITLLLGPVLAYSVLFTAAFAGSAAAAFFALSRYVSWIPAAFAGGLLYGFSPFMVGQGLGHLFLILAPLPPLILVCLDDIVVRRRHRWWAAGGALGLLAACQMLISTELLAMFGLMAVIGLVVLGLARRDLARERWRRVGASLAAASIVFAALAAFPLYVMVLGPAHITGPIHPVKVLAGLSTDLLGVVAPGSNQHFSLGLAATTDTWVHFASGKGVPVPDVGENGGYIGLPLLAFLLAGLYRFRRDKLVCLCRLDGRRRLGALDGLDVARGRPLTRDTPALPPSDQAAAAPERGPVPLLAHDVVLHRSAGRRHPRSCLAGVEVSGTVCRASGTVPAHGTQAQGNRRARRGVGGAGRRLPRPGLALPLAFRLGAGMVHVARRAGASLREHLVDLSGGPQPLHLA